MGKLINRIPGSHLLISSLLGSTLRTRVESLGKPRDVNKRSQSLAYMAANASVKTSRLCFFSVGTTILLLDFMGIVDFEFREENVMCDLTRKTTIYQIGILAKHTVVVPLRLFGSRHPLRCYSKITFK